MGAQKCPPAAASRGIRLPLSSIKLVFITFWTLLLSSLSPSSSSSPSSWWWWGSTCVRAAAADGALIDISTTESLMRFKSTLSYNEAFDTWNPSKFPSPCSGNYATWRGVLCSDGIVWGLQLENMGLTGQIDVDSLIPLHSLRTISLTNNSFQGSMPDWSKLGALKSLFLSNNRFSGQIPDDTFKGMTYLKKVYLGNNNFTGTIPTSLSTPRLLELRLENNQFTGLIPDFRPGLKLLNVSNNQLEGPIPSALAKMDPTSFQGNKNVCGPPLGTCNNSLPPLPDQAVSPLTANNDDNQLANAPTIGISSSSGQLLYRDVIIAIAGLIALVIVIVLFAIYQRSKKDQTPTLGRAVNTSTEKHGSSSDNLQVVGMEANSNYTNKTAPLPVAANINNAGGPGKKTRNNDTNKLSFVRDDRQQFDLQDLLRASAEVLGSGNFGSSYKAVLMDDQAVVVKRFKQMNNVGKEDFHEHMRRLGRLVHPNLLPLVAYYYRKEEKLLVFDYIQNGSLARHLHGNHSVDQPALDWPTRLNIVKGVTKGLAYLHAELPSVSLPHGHLKSSNVVLDKNYQPLLMDYALVPVVNPEQVQHLLVAYKSPEYAQHRSITRKTDVWNLGILILEILTSTFPANYIAQETIPGSSYSSYISELATWIDHFSPTSTDASKKNPKEGNVFDMEMGNTKSSEGQMRKLFKIGLACCDKDLEKRWDLKDVVAKIEEINERDTKERNHHLESVEMI